MKLWEVVGTHHAGLGRPPRDSGPNPATSRVGGGTATCSCLCFARFLWLHGSIVWDGLGETFEKAPAVIQARDDSGLAWGGGGYGEKAWKGFHCLFSV